jgi:hypothetical protein
MQIDEALCVSNLLGAGLGDPATWWLWLTILKAAFGLPLSPGELAFFQSISGQRAAPTAPVRERRSGKSRVAAALAVYLHSTS